MKPEHQKLQFQNYLQQIPFIIRTNQFVTAPSSVTKESSNLRFSSQSNSIKKNKKKLQFQFSERVSHEFEIPQNPHKVNIRILKDPRKMTFKTPFEKIDVVTYQSQLISNNQLDVLSQELNSDAKFTNTTIQDSVSRKKDNYNPNQRNQITDQLNLNMNKAQIQNEPLQKYSTSKRNRYQIQNIEQKIISTPLSMPKKFINKKSNSAAIHNINDKSSKFLTSDYQKTYLENLYAISGNSYKILSQNIKNSSKYEQVNHPYQERILNEKTNSKESETSRFQKNNNDQQLLQRIISNEELHKIQSQQINISDISICKEKNQKVRNLSQLLQMSNSTNHQSAEQLSKNKTNLQTYTQNITKGKKRMQSAALNFKEQKKMGVIREKQFSNGDYGVDEIRHSKQFMSSENFVKDFVKLKTRNSANRTEVQTRGPSKFGFALKVDSLLNQGQPYPLPQQIFPEHIGKTFNNQLYISDIEAEYGVSDQQIKFQVPQLVNNNSQSSINSKMISSVKKFGSSLKINSIEDSMANDFLKRQQVFSHLQELKTNEPVASMIDPFFQKIDQIKQFSQRQDATHLDKNKKLLQLRDQIQNCKNLRINNKNKRCQDIIEQFKLYDQINPTSSLQQSESKDEFKPSMVKYEKKKKAFQRVYDKMLVHLRSLDENLFGPEPILGDDVLKTQQDIIDNNEDQNINNNSKIQSTPLRQSILIKKSSDIQKTFGSPKQDQTSTQEIDLSKEYGSCSFINQIEDDETVGLQQQLNIYPNNRKNIKIISNRLKLLKQQEKESKKSVFTQQRRQDLQISLDPVRLMSLRVIPISRCLSVRAYHDKCFVKAVQSCLRNEVTQAIDVLHKGLTLNPNHFYCRFTHGVIMMKIGLLNQARYDFKLVSELYPTEHFSHFNYAIVLIQFQEYQEALNVLKKITQSSKKDYDLLIDTQILKAQCYWRIKEPIEAVKCFQNVERLRIRDDRKQTKLPAKKVDLETELKNLQIKQIQTDLETEKLKSLEGKSSSPHIESTFERVQKYKKVKYNIDEQFNLNNMNSRSIQIMSTNQSQPEEKYNKLSFQKETLKSSYDFKINDDVVQIVSFFENQRSLSCRKLENLTKPISVGEQTPSFDYQKVQEKTPIMNILEKNSIPIEKESIEQYKSLKTNLLEMITNIHSQEISNLYIKLQQFSKQLMKTSMQFTPPDKPDLSHEIIIEMLTKMLVKLEVSQTSIDKLIYKRQDKASIKSKNLVGVDFHPDGIVQINKDSDILEEIQQQVYGKLDQASQLIDFELDREDQRILNQHLNSLNLEDFKQLSVFNPRRLIQQLRDSLQSQTNMPYDLLNILKNDLKRKEIQNQKEEMVHNIERIDFKIMQMIKKEFLQKQGTDRTLLVLDMFLGKLEFLSTLNTEKRMLLYSESKLITLSARHVIFKQGDVGDKMYIIIKGRVAVEQCSEFTQNLPVIIGVLTDGHKFGEFALLDKIKIIQKQLTDKEHLQVPHFYQRLATCVTAEETDILEISHQQAAKIFEKDDVEFIETKIPDGESFSSEIIDLNYQSDATLAFINRKTKAMLAIPFLKEIHPKFIQKMLESITVQTFKFGECLVRQGEVPAGLFIILNGQCRVAARRLNKRLLYDKNNYDDIGRVSDKKLGIVDKILSKYDPRTTILNQNITAQVHFQNDVVYQQNQSNKINYIDYVTFKQLVKGDYFGARCLVPTDYYWNNKKSLCDDPEQFEDMFGDKDDELMKSYLSVVADSAKVEAWLIDKRLISILNEKIQKELYEKICLQTDIDRPFEQQDLKYLCKQFDLLDDYKIQFSQSLF